MTDDDPFDGADLPEDPQDDDPEPPLEEEEREMLQQDLLDVEMLKDLLAPRGIKGTVFYCPDCDEDHFLTWDLLKGNLQELLSEGRSPVHEPAFEPDPDEYISWDYARGFLDGYEGFAQEELGEIALRIVLELRDRGWQPDQVKALLAAVGLELPLASDGGGDGR